MVEELAAAANIPKPKVGISNTMVPNAFAYGRSKRSGHICVTRGILGLLDEEELKIGKPNVDWWNREEGPFIKSDGIHALEPQNVVLISSGSENKLIQFGNKSID
jgi:hypothetical protein